MSSLNKVMLIGHLGADPEMRRFNDDTAVCNLRIATTDRWKDKETGDQREATEWHRVTLYRRLGEIAGQYLRKGSAIYVEGRLRTRKWTDKEGVERYTTEIEGTEMQMLGARTKAEQEPTHQTATSAKSISQPPITASAWVDDDPLPF